jgi:hypothetical protein
MRMTKIATAIAMAASAGLNAAVVLEPLQMSIGVQSDSDAKEIRDNMAKAVKNSVIR